MKIATIAALIGTASAFAPANVGKVRLLWNFFVTHFFMWMRMCSDEREMASENSDVERRCCGWRQFYSDAQHKLLQIRMTINYSINYFWGWGEIFFAESLGAVVVLGRLPSRARRKTRRCAVAGCPLWQERTQKHTYIFMLPGLKFTSVVCQEIFKERLRFDRILEGQSLFLCLVPNQGKVTGAAVAAACNMKKWFTALAQYWSRILVKYGEKKLCIWCDMTGLAFVQFRVSLKWFWITAPRKMQYPLWSIQNSTLEALAVVSNSTPFFYYSLYFCLSFLHSLATH